MTDYRVAVVTGAANGIGRAVAAAFAAQGMKVVLSDVDEEALSAAVAALRSEGHDVCGVPSDVSRREDVERLRDESVRAYGHVHVLCNNAGVVKHTGQPIWELTENDWRWLVGVNLFGVVNGVRAFVPHMLSHGERSHVVNTASIAGLVVGAGAYGVTKHATVAFSESLLIDLQARGSNISVTCLCPGLVATEISRSERRRPPEFANSEPESETHAAFRARVDAFHAARGAPPAEVAERLLEAMRTKEFYVCLGDPPTVEPADERIRQRMEDILHRRSPMAFPLRRE